MNSKLTRHLLLSCSLIFLCVSQSDAQITAGTIDTFSAASADGWTEGNNSPNQPTQNAGLGFDGLAGHLQNISDGGGSGGRWLMLNDDARWTGDYLSAGVSSIALDFDNRSNNGTAANLRIALDGPGGWFISDDFVVADGSGWQQFGFDLGSLNHLANGTGQLSDTLSSVTNFEILSSVSDLPNITGSGFVQGDNLVADFRVDNISAVAAIPEPGSLALIGIGAFGIMIRRRK